MNQVNNATQIGMILLLEEENKRTREGEKGKKS
jgi:hypothetical protein